YFDQEQKYHYIKRFTINESIKEESLIGENEKSKLFELSDELYPRYEIKYDKKQTRKEDEIIDVEEFIAVKRYKAKGKRLSNYRIKEIIPLEPVQKEKEIEPIFEIEGDPIKVPNEDHLLEKPVIQTQMKLDL
ncbi:MAG: DNA gyrase/topoisomerase IV subunit A, partial [Bacteroidales bacterium]|nr:DNA gyrase/topoisomerase IV subunit A [Bacteroidales bacterium]